MIKLIPVVFIFFLTISCSDDSFEKHAAANAYEVTHINPTTGKYGDTIKIIGTNLTKIAQLSWGYRDQNFNSNSLTSFPSGFISRTDTEIQVRVPAALTHEDLRISFLNQTSFDFNLVGFVPIGLNVNLARWQTVTDDIAYATDGKVLYKSEDGYFTWEVIYDPPGDIRISSIFYLDENNFWIGIQGESGGSEGTSLYYSSDGGKDFSSVFKISNDNSGSPITKIHFTSPTNGYFVDNKYEMYYTDNTSFTNIYDKYPSLNTLPFGKINVFDFHVANENTFFLGPNEKRYLVKIENEIASYTEFDQSPYAPQFINNTGYLQVNGYLYKSVDLGETWTKLRTFDGYHLEIHFINENVGFVNATSNPNVVYKTIDGGNSWYRYWSAKYDYNYAVPMVSPKFTFILGNSWKYVEE